MQATTQAQVQALDDRSKKKLQALDEKALQSGFSDMLELLAYPINRIACEVCMFLNAKTDIV